MLGDLLAIPDWFLNYYSGYILYPSVPNNIQYIIISYVFEMVESPSLTKNMFAANPMFARIGSRISFDMLKSLRVFFTF